MKGVYWRPRRISRPALLLIIIVAVGGFLCVERFPVRNHFRYYNEQLEAARIAVKAIEVLRAERLKTKPSIDTFLDPAQTGLIGPMLTSVTSEVGELEAKQAALNPNFAALVVHFLKLAGVRKGDCVAVGYTGSFPGMNIAVCSAMQAMKLKPVIIASASASQWGATDPEFLWIDMERILNEKGLISFRSSAASIGGIDDMGKGLAARGRELLAAAIQKNGLRLLQPANFRESITQHMQIYSSHSAPISAYINVGGGMTSIGGRRDRHLFKNGLMRSLPEKMAHHDSVMYRFLSQKVPAVNLINVERLARHYGITAEFTTLPAPGEGEIYFREWYNPYITGGALAAIIFTLYLFFRSDWGFR
ncbi:MAG TPA: poly-gamma-glutamate system protein, partial [Thermodesulfobacteriota bacterium]|nr:poly-gamma-glutamate system protein [Thermodesulfobacteriota bacterium]